MFLCKSSFLGFVTAANLLSIGRAQLSLVEFGAVQVPASYNVLSANSFEISGLGQLPSNHPFFYYPESRTDFDVTMFVEGLEDETNNLGAMVGIMIKDDVDSSNTGAFIYLTIGGRTASDKSGGKYIRMQWRSVGGSYSQYTFYPTPTYADATAFNTYRMWLRLKKEGNSVIGMFKSETATEWTTVLDGVTWYHPTITWADSNTFVGITLASQYESSTVSAAKFTVSNFDISSPTMSPTMSPTFKPTSTPTLSPTKRPSSKPTTSPTLSPTKSPSSKPTTSPTLSPTKSPSSKPTTSPTLSPTKSPSNKPTTSPVKSITLSPTKSPTNVPTSSPVKTLTLSPTKSPTSSPFKSPTKSPSSKPTSSPTTAQPTSSPTTSQPVTAGSYQWHAVNEACVQDCPLASGEYCRGIVDQGTAVDFYTNAIDCCDYEVSWTALSCKFYSGVEVLGSNLWYKSGEGTKCVRDCPEDSNDPDSFCGGLELSGYDPTFDSASRCCDMSFASEANTCKLNSGVEGSGKWFIDWGENKCVKDCPVDANDLSCGGLVGQGTLLHADAEICCTSSVSAWDLLSCKVNSGVAVEGTKKYYSAGPSEFKCFKDCVADPNDPDTASCGGLNIDGASMYDDATTCCSQNFATKFATCKENSGIEGTRKWYANRKNNIGDSECNQDCLVDSSEPHCVGLIDNSQQALYDDAETCCSNHFGYDLNQCKHNSGIENVGTEKWYALYDGSLTCVRDCVDTVANCGGLAYTWNTLYDSCDECHEKGLYIDAAGCP